MATTTNYSWTTPDDTDLVKDGASAIRSLGSAIDSTVFTNAGNAVQKSTIDAKGDLLVGTADNTIGRLAVGTNGQTLVADSSTSTGLAWAAAAAGGLTLISETTASAVSSITFSAISGSYKQLLLVWAGIQHSDAGSDFGIRFNNNSGSVYANSGLGHLNTPAYTNVYLGSLTTCIGNSNFFPFGTDASGAALINSAKGSLLVDNYASSTKAKTFICSFGFNDQNVGERQATINGIFNDTTAITSIEIVRITGTDTLSNQTDTTIRLYGVS